jgi:transcriptional regulator with XRE-family HTH domain
MARSGAAGFSPARLRGALAQAGTTPAQLARDAGISPSDISKYTSGRAAPQPP